MKDIFRIEIHIEPLSGFDKKEFMSTVGTYLINFGYTIDEVAYAEKVIDQEEGSPFRFGLPNLDMAIFDIVYYNNVNDKELLGSIGFAINQCEKMNFKSHGFDPKIITKE